jgi:hypothetical protein
MTVLAAMSAKPIQAEGPAAIFLDGGAGQDGRSDIAFAPPLAGPGL